VAEGVVPGAHVQTAFGKGVVEEVLNGGRVRVLVQGRLLVCAVADLKAVAPETRKGKRRSATDESGTRESAAPPRPLDIDLHGLTVDQALATVDRALNDAMLGDRPEVRFVHGKGTGRIAAALHQRLRQIPSVRSFRVDPGNEGVTIAYL
jgi:DNA mismatch repair protein MutS2